MTDKFEQIEDYLAGRLTGEAREQFERAAQNDPELAAQLALYRDMASSLAPAPEDALRASLDQLNRRQARKNRRWWWLAALLLLTAGAAVWLIRRPSAPPAAPPQNTQLGAPPVAQQTTPASPPTPNPDSLKRPPDTGSRPEAPPPRLAAAFEPNPRLEAQLGSRMRGDDYRFRIHRPAANAALKRLGGKVDFLLSGALETGAARVDAPFRLLVFSNKPQDYADFRFLLAAPLAFEKSGDAFRFQYTSSLKMTPGLYYFLIEAEDSGLVYYGAKFRVED